MRIKKPSFHFSLAKDQEKAVSSSVAVVIIIGILALVNILGSRYFGRLDLTRDQAFTLSKASKDLVANLDDNLTAKVYFTPDLPAPYNDYQKFLQDKLAEYKVYGKGKFNYEFIDPTSADGQQQIQAYGIQPIQFNEMQSDQYLVKNGYMGVAFVYGDMTPEVIPAISSTATLEYDISSTIKKLTRPQKVTVAFLQDETTFTGLSEEFQAAYSALRQLYDVTAVTADTIPADLSVLIVAGMKNSLSDYALYQIDQSLMRGTKVMFLVDSLTVNLNGFTTTPITNSIAAMLTSDGVPVTPGLVADPKAQRISVSSRQGNYTVSNVVDYPLIPLITSFGSGNVITANLQQLSLPFVSSLKVADNTQAGQTASVLAQSSDKSWNMTTTTSINPLQPYTPGSPKGPFTLAIALQGPFSSYFANTAIPAPPVSADGSLTPAPDPSAQINSIADNRIIVVGSSTFIQDFYLMDQANLNFFVNSVDYLTQNDDLISIRSKGLDPAPLKELGDGLKNFIKWGTIIGLPALVVILAIVRFKLRKRATERTYRETR